MTIQFTANANMPYPQQGVDTFWGTTLNDEIQVCDLKFGSTYLQPLSNITPIVYVASTSQGSVVPTQFQVIKLTGILTTNIVIQYPPGVGGTWYIDNETSGAHTVTFQVGTGLGTTIIPPQGYRTLIYSDGTNMGIASTVPFWVFAPPIANNLIIANTSGSSAAPSPVNPSTMNFASGLNMGGGTITNVATPVNPTDGVNKQYVDNQIATLLTNYLPIGSIMSFGLNSGGAIVSQEPYYYFCDGRAVSRTTDAALFAVIGTAFGVGDGSTTFNIPNLQDEFQRGASGPSGPNPSRPIGNAQLDAVQNATGNINGVHPGPENITTTGVFSHVSSGFTTDNNAGGYQSQNITMNLSSQIRTSTETRPVNIYIPMYIKRI